MLLRVRGCRDAQRSGPLPFRRTSFPFPTSVRPDSHGTGVEGRHPFLDYFALLSNQRLGVYLSPSRDFLLSECVPVRCFQPEKRRVCLSPVGGSTQPLFFFFFLNFYETRTLRAGLFFQLIPQAGSFSLLELVVKGPEADCFPLFIAPPLRISDLALLIAPFLSPVRLVALPPRFDLLVSPWFCRQL